MKSDPPCRSVAGAKARYGSFGMIKPRVLLGRHRVTELMRLTQIELCDLAARITNCLPELPEGSAERHIALINLRYIRWVLARRNFSR